MKSQQKIKALLNDTDIGNVDKNVERLCCHEVKAVEYFELLDYTVYECSHLESLKLPVKQFYFSKAADCNPATLLNLNTYTIFRTRYGVPKTDLGLSCDEVLCDIS